MRSAVAELIEDFLARGGKITPCPEGNGLIDPAFRPKKTVGRALSAQKRHARISGRVVRVLAMSPAPMTLLAIEKQTGLPFDSLRYVVNILALDGKITVTQSAKRQTRFFSLAPANTDTEFSTGGPASESTPAARVGDACSAGARPGSAAA
jgi:hypothetical protein